jgi:hypothetical protein
MISYIITIAPNPCSLCWCARNHGQLLSGREDSTIRVPWDGGCRFVHCQKVLDLCQSRVRRVLRLRHDAVVWCCGVLLAAVATELKDLSVVHDGFKDVLIEVLTASTTTEVFKTIPPHSLPPGS